MASVGRKRTPTETESSPVEGEGEKRQRISAQCEWILHRPEYKKWRTGADSASSILWIHGPPGCGKTIIARSIVEFIQQEDVELRSIVLAYFCDANSTPSLIMRSILSNLLQHPALKEETRKKVVDSLKEPLSGDQVLPVNVSHKLWETFRNALPELSNVTILLDGLDELPENYLQPMDFDLPSKLASLPSINSNLKFVLSSRTQASIWKAFGHYPQLLLTEEMVKDDLERFIDSEISYLPWSETWKSLGSKAIFEQSEGNFLWAKLSIEALASRISAVPYTESINESLRNIKTSLDALYTSIILKQATVLTPSEMSLRSMILSWLIFAVRPLHAYELVDALAGQFNENIEDLNSEALRVCGSLIKTENGALKPVHHSLREFLLGDREIIDETVKVDHKSSNLMIAKSLLGYLSLPAVSSIEGPLNEHQFQRTHPLAEYATLYWVHHVTNAGPDTNLQELIDDFFGNSDTCIMWADKLLPHFLPRSVLSVPPRPFNTARFFQLFMFKGKLVSYFPGNERQAFAAKVEDLFEQVYEGFLVRAQSKAGPESLEAAQRLEDLAQIYSWLPRRKFKALPLLQAASFIVSKKIEPESQPLRAAVLQALADEYKRAGKYQDARKLLEIMLADKILLSDDFARMFALDSLGWVHKRVGEAQAAEPLLREATELAARIYGSGSPMTLRPKVTLAEVLSTLGRHEEAALFCEELKRQLEEHRATNVPLPKDSISHLHTLGMILIQEEKFKEAVDTYRVVVDDRKKLFGDEHGMTLGAEMQLGIALDKSGDFEGARLIFEDLVPRQIKALGEEHPDVRSSKQRLAELH